MNTLVLAVLMAALRMGWVCAVVGWVRWRIVRDDLRAEKALSVARLDEKLKLEKRLACMDAQAFARGRLSVKQEAGLH